jgi:hypothetical protein
LLVTQSTFDPFTGFGGKTTLLRQLWLLRRLFRQHMLWMLLEGITEEVHLLSKSLTSFTTVDMKPHNDPQHNRELAIHPLREQARRF